MKGVIFNTVERFIADGWGEEAYEDIVGRCPLQTRDPFVGPGTYPDADLVAIVTEAARTLDVPLEDALRAAGRFAFPHLKRKLGAAADQWDDPKAFLRALDSVIHVEVRKLYPEAVTPRFTILEPPEVPRFTLRYESPRKLCHLAEGLVEGLGDDFGVSITSEQVRCVHHGDPACDLALTFEAPG